MAKAKETLTEEQMLLALLPFLKLAQVDRSGNEIKACLPGFSLENIAGKTVASKIKLLNPLSFNHRGESPNPNEFRVLVFGDGTYLLFDEVKYTGRTTLHSFLIDSQEIRYSNSLPRELQL